MNFGLKVCSEKGDNIIYEPFNWLSEKLCVLSFLIFRRLKHLQIAFPVSLLILFFFNYYSPSAKKFTQNAFLPLDLVPALIPPPLFLALPFGEGSKMKIVNRAL